MDNVNVTLRRTIAAGAVLLVPLLASCGFDRPTDKVYNPGVGVNDRSGQVNVLHALIVSGEEGSGTVVASLVNSNGTQDDALTRIAGSGEDSSVSVTLNGSVDIPADGATQLAEEGITAEGQSVKSGTFVELTFSFERGENVTLQVPVVANRGDFAEVPLPGSGSPSNSPSEEASPSGKKSPAQEASPSEEASPTS